VLHRLSHVCDKKRDPAAPARSTLYDLAHAGRVTILYMGRSAYLAESWEEIVRRIDAEDRAAGAAGGPRVKDRERAKRQREQEQPIA